MTAEPVEDVWSRTRTRDWTWADLQEIPNDGHRYEIIDGSLYVSPSPGRPHQIPVELRPAELAGPRSRG